MSDISVSNNKSIGNLDEINSIQKEIEFYTKNIEHEKINLRLAKERHQKQQENLIKLQNSGKPTIGKDKTIDKVAQQHARRTSMDFLSRESLKFESNLENLNDEINTLALENKDLRKKIEELRKNKLTSMHLLEQLKQTNTQTLGEFEELYRMNKKNKEDPDGIINLKKKDLELVKKQGQEENMVFAMNRDNLEKKYQEIVEENIKREREHKKEVTNKNPVNGVKKEDNDAALLADEDISDRAPILEALIDKWKYFIKAKKQMLDRYIRNSASITESFDKMTKYLGTDSYESLPFILEKMETQMSTIEMFISKLNNEQDKLDEEKRAYEDKIKILKEKSNLSNKKKKTYNENKANNINKLKEQIREIDADIEKRRKFFESLQEPTDDFLLKLENSYIKEFIPAKVSVNKEIKYSENNIIDIIANVQDYQKLIDELERNDKNKKKVYDQTINKDIDRLKGDIKNKLDQFKKENYQNSITNNMSTYKNETRSASGFDEAIKRMADEIVKMVNVSKKDEKKKK